MILALLRRMKNITRSVQIRTVRVQRVLPMRAITTPK